MTPELQEIWDLPENTKEEIKTKFETICFTDDRRFLREMSDYPNVHQLSKKLDILNIKYLKQI